jgi:hypothetical protein
MKDQWHKSSTVSVLFKGNMACKYLEEALPVRILSFDILLRAFACTAILHRYMVLTLSRI